MTGKPQFVLIHKGCGKPAYLLSEKPSKEDPLSSKTAFNLDGTPVDYSSEVKCGSCGENFTPRTEDVEELTH